MTVRGTLLALLLCGCAQRAAPPSADTPQRAFPDMAGRTIFVLPVQAAVPLIAAPENTGPLVPLTAEGRATLEAELAFWLEQAASGVRWVMPAAVERAAQRAPTLDVRVRELPVQDFLRAQLQSIGDPLYTELRKLGALLDVRPALIPIGAVWVPGTDGTGRVHVLAALVDSTGGRVLWQGIIAGAPGLRLDDAAIASAAEAIARRVSR